MHYLIVTTDSFNPKSKEKLKNLINYQYGFPLFVLKLCFPSWRLLPVKPLAGIYGGRLVLVVGLTFEILENPLAKHGEKRGGTE